MRPPRPRQRGFTFIEMALSLFSIGFLLAAVPRVIDQGQALAAAAPGAAPIDSAELALDGFVLSNNRLPCPAAAPHSGWEDCSRTRGFVPYKTLKLPRPVTNGSGFPIGYALLGDDANDNHLGKATAKYTPRYLDSTNEYWLAPTTLESKQVNGLDFCAKLRSAALRAPDSGLAGVKNVRGEGGVNVAWVLIDPGQSDADGAAGTGHPEFDAGNDPMQGSGWFESPARPQDQGYDDTVRAGTLTQLYGELRCAGLTAAVSAAAREADFANEQWRVRKFLYDFRSYELDVRKQQKIDAENSMALASFDVSMTVASGALDLGIALAGASGAGSIAVAAVTAVSTISMSAFGLSETVKDLAGAEAEVEEGVARRDAATTAVADASAFRTARREALLLLDRRSWFQ